MTFACFTGRCDEVYAGAYAKLLRGLLEDVKTKGDVFYKAGIRQGGDCMSSPELPLSLLLPHSPPPPHTHTTTDTQAKMMSITQFSHFTLAAIASEQGPTQAHMHAHHLHACTNMSALANGIHAWWTTSLLRMSLRIARCCWNCLGWIRLQCITCAW